MPWICSGNTFLIILLQFTGRRKNSWLGLGLSWLRNLFRCGIFSEKMQKNARRGSWCRWEWPSVSWLGLGLPQLRGRRHHHPLEPLFDLRLIARPRCLAIIVATPYHRQDCRIALHQDSGLPACRPPGGSPTQWSSWCLGSGRFESASSPSIVTTAVKRLRWKRMKRGFLLRQVFTIYDYN